MLLVALPLTFAFSLESAVAGGPWGKNYFPNVELTTHNGKTVRFFDDLLDGKIVAINFIYTSCPDTCPLETAQLVRVQNILGDRMGKDVFFYSISIDPEVDTPAVLSEYKDRFGANWTFLTGNEADIIEIRRKLGLYVEEIQDGSNNHNVNMIIGNQSTGRWMKRSPFENSYVLADQIGNWLDGWKAPPRGESYANAPKLRNVSKGEQLFRTRCTTCHTLTGHEKEGALGPDLIGITNRRDMNWLLNWMRAPDQMLQQKDPVAVALYEQYGQLAMPNMRLNRQEVDNLIEYMDAETVRVAAVTQVREPGIDAVAIMNAWVREADARATANAGYMTMVNVGSDDLTLVGVESDAFESVEVHEMSATNGLMRMQKLESIVIPANGQTQFKPGGKHLMLKGPQQTFSAGQLIDITLSFESGISQHVSLRVASD